ncbi:hypothetical protein H0266_17640 [Halobacillus locisalis]|uniref:Uncharacterized protein n=1 Tax=Halobacillus locisalis TaxID=220753 RepID=A0A838CY49_9BACI|nr:hypothetical protein [Halobacillus locisalis]MBA2176715.1 hypothetical protein [Halobacillus locisalis]
MNDLLDRKLKKLDRQLKYDEVPFDEEHMKKAVLRAPKARPSTTPSWIRRTAPLPLIAALTFFCIQFVTNPADHAIYTANMLPSKSSVTELKTQTNANLLSFDQKKADITSPSPKQSTMIRETYVIHNDHQFVQTGKTVQTEELGEVLGTIQIKRMMDETLRQETEIYSIKGEDDEDRIAIESRRNTGIGSTSISKQGYFVFERKEPLPQAQ